MAEVIAVSPKGKRIEMTTSGAKSHRHLMSVQGVDGWQYLNGNGLGAIPSPAKPVKRVSDTEDAKLSPTIEDVHSLLGDIFQRLGKIEAELTRNKGGRPKKQINAEVDN